MRPTRHRINTAARELRTAAIVALVLVAMTGCHFSLNGGKAKLHQQAAANVATANTLTQAGQLDEALRLFQQAIAENPTLGEAYMGVADIQSARGDYESAEIGYRTAAKLDPSSFTAQYKHGLVLQLLHRLSEAIRAYVRALSIEPEDFDANLNLATAYLQLHEANQALFYAQNAVRLNTRSGPARANLGAVYASLGRHNDAVRSYQAAAELMELTPQLLLNLADSLGRARRYQEMVNTLTELLKIAPSAQAYERLGSALFRQGKYDEALEAFAQAVKLDPDHYPALNGVAVCLLNRYVLSDRRDTQARRQAVQALRRSLRIKRDQAKIVDLLSRFG